MVAHQAQASKLGECFLDRHNQAVLTAHGEDQADAFLPVFGDNQTARISWQSERLIPIPKYSPNVLEALVRLVDFFL